MLDFWEWKIRDGTVEWRNRLYLWDKDDDVWTWQVVLVVEEWCLKLYSYIYSGWYRWENWKKCEDFFYNFEGWLDVSTLGYVKVDFYDIEYTTAELVKLCQRELTCNINWHTSDISYFLERHEKNIVPVTKVYTYYK